MSVNQDGFNPERSLPSGKDWFSIRWLARHWDCSEDSIQRLVDCGDLFVAVDIAPNTSTVKAMIRIPRKAVVDFLNRRKR